MDISATLGAVSISYINGCLTETVGGQTTRRCGGAPPLSASTLPPALQSIYNQIDPTIVRLAQNRPDLGFFTVEENGRYYLSPVRTLLQDLDAYLGKLRPGDLTTFASAFTEFQQALKSGALPLAPGTPPTTSPG